MLFSKVLFLIGISICIVLCSGSNSTMGKSTSGLDSDSTSGVAGQEHSCPAPKTYSFVNDGAECTFSAPWLPAPSNVKYCKSPSTCVRSATGATCISKTAVSNAHGMACTSDKDCVEDAPPMGGIGLTCLTKAGTTTKKCGWAIKFGPAVIGMLHVGDKCALSEECSGDATCDSSGVCSVSTVAGDSCSSGTTLCPNGMFCDSTTNKCTAAMAKDGACTMSDECQAGLFCAANKCVLGYSAADGTLVDDPEACMSGVYVRTSASTTAGHCQSTGGSTQKKAGMDCTAETGTARYTFCGSGSSCQCTTESPTKKRCQPFETPKPADATNMNAFYQCLNTNQASLSRNSLPMWRESAAFKNCKTKFRAAVCTRKGGMKSALSSLKQYWKGDNWDAEFAGISRFCSGYANWADWSAAFGAAMAVFAAAATMLVTIVIIVVVVVVLCIIVCCFLCLRKKKTQVIVVQQAPQQAVAMQPVMIAS